ncbi:NAD-dependent deacylase [Sphingobacterium sp. DK4209]|uniref:NAD-dependent protein deacylase n=1 Tax=Sphingobacterium zhuxiongii TaxID=2662364 RepID=A0A5Q0QFN7_9SPHI|nr:MULTISPECIES: NAD-dependent deacylase [unclassified Sphingobacterium]MVZ66944.1 NAD-dependent deacylase [Sphingobacterium sp. DK4209]QGA26638.1 NAD-dependent deacylase [Sphingobacterium sp. dk4302]
MKKIVVFTGAGISVESGLPTFRGSDGLWEGHRIEEVATPEAWQRNPELVQRFYNLRRRDCLRVEPNAAHAYLADLEKNYDVQIITQNIDDLHERAGSTKVLHLHGQIRKSQSSRNANLVYDIQGDDLPMGALCELGSQLRPHVVWFGEAVPNMAVASSMVEQADVFIIIGTSLQVYPAANLLFDCKAGCQIILIDPNAKQVPIPANVYKIAENASKGITYLAELLTK